MIRERHKAGGRLGRFAALPALVLAVAAQAQAPGSVQDYRLPPASPTPTPTAAGPVDSEHPVAAPTHPAPTPGAPASPTPAPSPTGAVPPPAATQSTVRPSASPSPRAERTAATPPVAGPSLAPTAPQSTEAASPAAAPGFETVPSAAASATAEPLTSGDRPVWPWAAGAAAVLGLAGFLLWRRRRPAEAEAHYEPAPPPPEAQPSPPAALTPPPRREPKTAAAPPPPSPSPPSQPQPAPPQPLATAEPRPIEMQLEARHLSRALVNATLAYRLTLTNRGGAPAGPLRILGDITSAHASLSAQEQLSLDGGSLATLHEVPALPPGGSLTLSGELRLPLASILPIHSGGARVFVPLARFRIEAASEVLATRVFVVGQASEVPGGALRPFPLDRGPGVDRILGQRELELPA